MCGVCVNRSYFRVEKRQAVGCDLLRLRRYYGRVIFIFSYLRSGKFRTESVVEPYFLPSVVGSVRGDAVFKGQTVDYESHGDSNSYRYDRHFYIVFSLYEFTPYAESGQNVRGGRGILILS